MKRNKHSLSHYRLLTADMGKLVPCGLLEVLPGDTMQQATSMLLRVTPLMAPVMHPVSVRVHHWFVPMRLVWPEGWERFITGHEEVPVIPTETAPAGGYPNGGLHDYLGVPPGVDGIEISQLPARAYNLIFNEFYRDQDLVQPVLPNSNVVQTVAWEKDYFTAARPWPQKGDDVTIPIAASAAVVPTGALPTFQDQAGGPARNLTTNAGQSATSWSDAPGASAHQKWSDPALSVDLTGATAVNVNDVRLAFALQRYQEARAQYGSRYTEYLRYLGVRSSDARLQRPEYLGGGKQTISFSEVLVTGTGLSADDPVGTMKGHGIAGMRSRRYRRFFEEHGYVLSLLSVRPRSMYTDGLHRMWSRKTKEDFWQRELEQIGQQEVFRREVYAEADAAGAGGDSVWGYQDRYAEYKHNPSTVHAEFRDLMNYWHYGRSFASAPGLNQSFIECDPTKRVYAEQTQDALWLMVNHSIQARRMVRRAANSRIL